MPVETHLLSDESVRARFEGPTYEWVATDRRLLKYRESGGSEELDDLSYDEVSGISLTNDGRDSGKLVGGVVGGVVLVGVTVVGLGVGALPLGLLLFCVSVGVGAVLWWRSSGQAFEFRGSGMLEDSDEWRIDVAGDSGDGAKEFVKAVREQL